VQDDEHLGLSPAAGSVWAKSRRDEQGEIEAWMPLWRHLDDTAAVAGRLWDEWLPESVRQVIAASVDGDQTSARRWAVWLAAVHDLGKATPVFAVQAQRLADAMHRHGLEVYGPYAERSSLRHELAGHICVSHWLRDRHGWSKPDAERLAVVVGGHHGVAPSPQQLNTGERLTQLMGSGRWAEVRTEFLDRQARFLNEDDLAVAPVLAQPAQVLLTALVIVADWIASNEDLFPYSVTECTADRLERAWRDLDLPRPWQSAPETSDVDTLLRSRFGFTGTARPVQRSAVRAAQELDGPGLLVVEAPMGEGKTEAALLAAEILAERSGAGGCFVALPTQATTDAMFGRVAAWLERLPGSDRRSIFLAHGKASLNDTYCGLMASNRVVSVAVDDDTPADARPSSVTGYAVHLAVQTVVHQWLQGRKKGVLASFVVGTVDQTLFTALKSKHLMLRHLALAGKVVVIDEVHAYDTYMSSYLDRALHWLGAYGAPVVLLSATLPAKRREQMIAAYRSGQAAAAARPAVPAEAVPEDGAYPALTAASVDRVKRYPTPASGRRTSVRLERLDDDLDELADLLDDALAEGGSALVVRNTVTRVQETGRFLTDRFGAEHVTVVHARFLAVDRAENDKRLLASFGPPGADRPVRHIVVGSQVVEQSLDVDFDLLVTDLAPVDLVLQRMGRLHRHARGDDQGDRPPRLRAARCLISGVDWAQTPPKPVAGSRMVYGEHPLLRSLAVLSPHIDGGLPVQLPDDIAPLVQTAYGTEPLGPPTWAEAMGQAHRADAAQAADAANRARTFQLGKVDPDGDAVVEWVSGGVGDADDGPTGEAQVRDGQLSLEVLVVVEDQGNLFVPHWVTGRGGELLSTQLEIDSRQAQVVASCALRLPPALSNPSAIDATIADLERRWVPAWQRSRLLAGQLLLVLDAEGRAEVAGRQLHYTRRNGLEVLRP
jgi:CRISPR-associated endonuclease/helicase Cas3